MSQKRIFIADDDADILEVTQLILEMAGYSVTTCRIFHQIEEKLLNESYDFILLDIWMSGVDGRDICKSIKKNEKTSYVPIVLFSANKAMKMSALSAGANDFMEKPFDRTTLLNLILKHTA